MIKTKELTKEWLISQNISVEGADIYRVNGITGKRYKIPYLRIKGKGKYSTPKEYLAIGIWDNTLKKQFTIMVHRVIFAWYNGIAHAGLTIDHIDSNPMNNDISNLRECTLAENLQFKSKLKSGNNQYINKDLVSDEQIEELKRVNLLAVEKRIKNRKENDKLRLRLKEVESKIAAIKKEYWKALRKVKSEVFTDESLNSYQKPVEYDLRRNNLKSIYYEDINKYELEAKSLRSAIHNNVKEYELAFTKAQNLKKVFTNK